jgi:hypothetical protein
MPINYRDYPKNWPEIRASVLERAKSKCEFCGVENYEYGGRDKMGVWHSLEDIGKMSSERIGATFFGEPKIIRIVLTIAHLDHDIRHNDESNLRALCQRCHLCYDKAHHARNSRITRMKKRGQLELVSGE